MKKILVTGIGGVVGQGILRNIQDLNPNIPLVGINVELVSAGNYLCDIVYKVPYAYELEYIADVLKICQQENVGLVIPSTDYESYHLGKNKNLFSCQIATSPFIVTEFCLDKFKNFLAFKKFSIPFAESILPSEFNGEFEKYVVKPREGRGSRGVFINPQNPKSYDDTNVIQKYLEGDELTTTFYVKDNGKLHGLITFKRYLEQGNTVKAEVVYKYDDELKSIIQNMIKHYPFRGSINIQSKVTKNGIIPFEINCRISGTNSLRSQFGFNDVAYTIQEQYFNMEPELPNVSYGCALRVIIDIIYPNITFNDIKNKNDKFYLH